MDRERAQNFLRGLQSSLAARGIAHVAVFGSVVRDEGNEQSDIDVLVTPRQGARLDLFDLGGIQTILEEAFRVDVDVVVSPVRNVELHCAISYPGTARTPSENIFA